jgi:hypothetical protein
MKARKPLLHVGIGEERVRLDEALRAVRKEPCSRGLVEVAFRCRTRENAVGEAIERGMNKRTLNDGAS